MIIPQNIDFAEYIKFIGTQESQSLDWASKWSDELVEHLTNPDEINGSVLPWQKTESIVRFRGGEISIHAGMNGHRKSMLVGMMMAWLAKEERVCIASLEMKPVETLARMARQVAGCYPSPQFGKKFLEWSYERICIYDQLDTVESERILGMIHYAAKELGCKHIMIDSLTKCGLDSADYKAEKKFIDRLQWAAKTWNCHIHLVAHVRKPHAAGEEYRPTKFDVRGCGELTDLVDNVFLYWRNKSKEKAVDKKQKGFSLNDQELRTVDQADQYLSVCKQRHGSWEGDISLWFDPNSLQFVGSDTNQKLQFDIGFSNGNT